jgi:hypothetical protein
MLREAAGEHFGGLYCNDLSGLELTFTQIFVKPVVMGDQLESQNAQYPLPSSQSSFVFAHREKEVKERKWEVVSFADLAGSSTERLEERHHERKYDYPRVSHNPSEGKCFDDLLTELTGTL